VSLYTGGQEHVAGVEVAPREVSPLRYDLRPEVFAAVERHGLAGYLVAAPKLGTRRGCVREHELVDRIVGVALQAWWLVDMA
jgi:hypothetical protein